MPAENWNDDPLEAMQAEHEELAGVLADFHEALMDQNRDRDVVEVLAVRLRDLVETHFRHEEHDGCLRDALERAQRFKRRADALVEQHDALLEEIEKLRILVRSGVESPAWWTRIDSDFHKFATRFLSHEHAEAELMQEAFKVDEESD